MPKGSKHQMPSKRWWSSRYI